MSARLRIVKGAGLLLSIGLTAACVHDVGSPARAATVYETRQGQRIAITPNAIAVGTAVHALTDCSDAENFCAASDEIGFRISFPRRCPGFVWFPESSGSMQMLSLFPHGGGARYTNRGGAPFVYVWQNNYGLVMLVYDPRTDFAARPNADPAEGPTVYQHKSGPRLFTCN
jgi:hypothetical protein